MQPEQRIPTRLLALGLILQGTWLLAADRIEPFKKGEEVEVLFLGDWLPGVVVDFNKRGEVLVDFSFAASTQQRVFSVAQVLHKYESGAIARARTWTDASGQFKVTAALLKVDAESATLRTADEKQIVIPIAKLSSVDQKFLLNFAEKLQAAEAISPSLPPLSEFDVASSRVIGPAVHELSKLAADRPVVAIELEEKGVPLPPLDTQDSLAAIIPLGGPKGWVLAATQNAFGSRGSASRLFWISLTDGQMQKMQALPAGEIVADYHPASQQLLTVSQREQASHDIPFLSVWRVGPTTEKANHLASWKSDTGIEARGGTRQWQRIATENLVIQQDSNGQVAAWDVGSKKLLWTTPQQSFFAPEPALSPGGKYLYLPEDQGVRVVDTLAGKTLGHIPTQDACSGIAVHRDGQRLAILANNDLVIYDIASSSTQVQEAGSIRMPIRARLQWVDDHLLAVEQTHRTFALYSLRERLPVWNFEFHMDVYRADRGTIGQTKSFVDNHLVYAASIGIGTQTGIAIGAVRMPGATVGPAIEKIRREDFLILKQGSSVKLDVSAASGAPGLEATLREKVLQCGWVVDPSAPAVIRASMKTGEPQTVSYDMQAFGGGSGSSQSVTFTPHISTLEIVVDGNVVWSTGTGSGAPGVVFLSQGQTLDQEVNRWQAPNTEFFSSVELPTEVVDPQKLKNLGVAEVSNRGIVVTKSP